MFIPLSVILGFIIWGFTTWVKWRITINYNYKYKIDNKLLQELQKGGRTSKKTQEALVKLQEKRKVEEEAKIAASKGKTLFEEVEERLKEKETGKKKGSGIKYDSDMFHDPVSRLYAEMMKKKKK